MTHVVIDSMGTGEDRMRINLSLASCVTMGKFAVTFSSHSQSGIQGLCVKIKHKNKYVTPASKPEKR